VISDTNIREYLLGLLDPDSKLVESIDEQVLTDPEFSVSVDVIEDEIIEEYLEGSLSSEEMRAVERHFLRPPERQRKLETARLFSRYVEAESRKEKTKRPAPARSLFSALRIGHVRPSFRTFAEIAALVVFAVLTLNLWNQRRELDIAIKQTNRQLGQERERLAVANQQLQSALQSMQPAIAMLNLVRPGLQRGELELPEAKVSSGTKTLHVEVALLSRTAGKYRVQLRHAGKTIWSQEGVDVAAVPGGAILKVDIPANVLSQGTGELAITPSGEGTISYWFSISKIQ
jgi:hypothetical protein